MNRSWYNASVADFLSHGDEYIIGNLLANSEFDVTQTQRDAWAYQIDTLKKQLAKVKYQKFHVFFEYRIPRMGSRIDIVLFIPSEKPHLILLEFKVGANRYSSADKDQVIDYALELKNFHKGSHTADIFPVLVASDAKYNDFYLNLRNGIADASCVNADSISELIELIEYNYLERNVKEWESSPYQPTPTIIEAARALWQDQNVNEITRSEGGAVNISKTSAKVNELIEDARKNRKKRIIFVTGVPGAGKTLVGLNVAADRRSSGDNHAVMLSGNGPLVKVLQESLARDEIKKSGIKKSEALAQVKSFIQIVHHYRDESIRNPSPPSEHIAIFDEAQRLWNERTLSDFMARKKGLTGFRKSEGEALIEYLDRHDDWAVCVCLVGGGQEINKGEAGIGAWIDAINTYFKNWEICISPNLHDSEYAAAALIDNTKNLLIHEELHLAVSMRSFRAENVSNFIKLLLDVDEKSRDIKLTNYPIYITRDLNVAKKWVRNQARGTERYGMLASSKALRLKPFAIDIKATINPIHYFLEGKNDTRSSYFLESVASEFDIQGLELDYSIVCWDADLRFNGNQWEYKDFKGNKWVAYNNTVNEPDRQSFLKNAYRVLLTRARQGMIIFIPLGNYPPDETRKPEYYDGTFNYLKSLGLKEIGAPYSDKGY